VIAVPIVVVANVPRRRGATRTASGSLWAWCLLGVGVGVLVGVALGVGVGVFVGVALGVGVGVLVGVGVMVGDGVGVRVATPPKAPTRNAPIVDGRELDACVTRQIQNGPHGTSALLPA